MSITWAVKAPAEIVEREWEVPTGDEDSLASYVVSASGVTVDADESNGDLITVTLSAGTADATATVDITATTANGLVITEKFYLPVRADGNKLAYTGRDICSFAVRKVVGNGGTVEADELDDALERLSDMLAGWAADGADLSVKLPVEANDIVYAPDWSIEPIKAALTANLFDFYDVPQTATVAQNARRGVQRIKANMLPNEREGADFF